MSFKDLWNTALPGGISLTFGKVASAVGVLLVCLIVIRILMRLLRRIMSRSKLEERVHKYLLMGVKLVLYIITAIIVADTLGINSSSFVALLSVASLGVTLAAEDVLGNVAGGLVLLSSRPFTLGDFIETDGVSGTVEEMALNHTKLVTLEGLIVMIPNRKLSSEKLTNYTALGRRRICQKVNAPYSASIDTVKAACRTALERTKGMLTDPAPSVYLTECRPSAMEYSVYCWAATADYWTVYLTLGENLRRVFEEQGIEMAYDHLNVHILDKNNM